MTGPQASLGGRPHGKHSSWVLAAAVVIAFVAGGAALIVHLWWLFWLCVGVVVLSIPLGKVIRIMDDTVVWGSTPARDEAAAPGLAQERAREHSALAQQAQDSSRT